MPKRVPEEAKIIGRNLRKVRKSLSLSQEDMGTYLGISFQQVQKYERGDNRLPIEKLYALRHLFNVPFSQFFEGLPAFDPVPLKGRAVISDFSPSSVLHSVDMLEDRALKRKIERIIEILLS